MHRKDKEITDKKLIEEILTKSEICRVAIFDNEFPYIVPFNYGYKDNTLYFHSATSGKKIDLLKKNSKVCFEITSSSEVIKGKETCDWTTKYRSVIGYGFIEIVSDEIGKKKGMDAIMVHYGRSENNVYHPKHYDNMLILKLSIQSLTGKQSGDWNDID